jgi:integrative and conjugative element protein (TIGR02256 family)
MSAPTRGQLLAQEQLRAIAARSDGALTVSSSADTADLPDWLTVTVRLDMGPAAEEQQGDPPDGGVRLERHEDATILVPALFPFQPPAITVTHDRFAGLPHVQWGRLICLYHSAADWDPAEGMLSVTLRLSAWLRRAALGHLHAPGQPLEPPIAYTSRWAGCAVIHENAPAAAEGATGEAWLGAAILRPGGTGRVDLVGWLSQRAEVYQHTDSLYECLDEQERRCGMPVFLGPAVILPGPLTFEFPSKVADLVDAAAQQGVTATELALLLGDVAWINQARTKQREAEGRRIAGPPLYALVGSPMRGIAGSATRLTHLAAWRLGGEEAGLAAALAQLWASPLPDQAEQAQRITDAVNDWIDYADVSWARVYELRPEIVERRDNKSAPRWLRGDDGSGRRVTVLGCGALGAPIAEQCLRAGVGKLTLVDNGRVSPGVLVRQPYEDADVGQPKATALAARLRRIRPGADIDAQVSDALIAILGNDSEPPDTDLLIDATASQTVAAKIEQRRWMSREPWPPVLTVAIGHLAERGIATLALPDATGASTDMLRKLALAARTAPHLADVADDFFPDPPRATSFQPEPGCSEPTFRGSATEVNALASQLLAGALAGLQASGPDGLATGSGQAAGEPAVPPMSARIARLPYAGSGNGSDQVTWVNDHAILDPGSGYQIRFSPPALDAMQDDAYGVRQALGPGIETGGILLGQMDDASQVIWVTSAIGPPPDSQRASSHIRLGTEGTAEFLAAVERSSGGRSHFIGMWHTHPGAEPSESETDRQAMAGLLADTGHPVHRALLVVLGGPAGQWDAWLEGQADPAIYTRLCR